MEKSNIIIPNPCSANWDEMTPNDKGKHCGSCNKTVIDFTTMNNEEIKHYFLSSSKMHKVCGHFKITQVSVNRPKHHQFLLDLYFKIESNFTASIFKTLKLSLIVLCMTVVGCNRPTSTRTTGQIAMPNKIDKLNSNIDTTNTLKGEVAIPNIKK
jgi:hypothetical protein